MSSGSQLFLNGLNGVGLQLSFDDETLTLIRGEAFSDWRSNPLIAEVNGKSIAVGEASMDDVLQHVRSWLRNESPWGD